MEFLLLAETIDSAAMACRYTGVSIESQLLPTHLDLLANSLALFWDYPIIPKKMVPKMSQGLEERVAAAFEKQAFLNLTLFSY